MCIPVWVVSNASVDDVDGDVGGRALVDVLVVEGQIALVDAVDAPRVRVGRGGGREGLRECRRAHHHVRLDELGPLLVQQRV